jgi:BirA family transcriptional regulator, biotin operon repressor / biotin---[acetyl-CoA-carboxylase] ligase
MRLVKLDAIDSTNDYLKALSQAGNLENFTVVSTDNQTKGKGQMGAKWNSEVGKNLTMSVLVNDFVADASRLFELNIVFSVAVIDTLHQLEIPQLSIKWPNDILSGNRKIAGILIENSLKSDGQIVSVIGLGLNVNQEDFEDLPQASSLRLVMDTFFEKETILVSVVENFKKSIDAWSLDAQKMTEAYEENLFKKGIPIPFENAEGVRFMGIIQGVSATGKLQLLHENDSVAEYEVKSIKMLY